MLFEFGLPSLRVGPSKSAFRPSVRHEGRCRPRAALTAFRLNKPSILRNWCLIQITTTANSPPKHHSSPSCGLEPRGADFREFVRTMPIQSFWRLAVEGFVENLPGRETNGTGKIRI